MTGIAIGAIMFAIMLALMVIRVPIGIAMFIVGAGAYVYLTGGQAAMLLNSFKNLAYARLSNYDLVVIPLFMLLAWLAPSTHSTFDFWSAVKAAIVVALIIVVGFYFCNRT